MNDPLDLLEHIKPVEVPPFLFTRIQQQIQNPKSEQLKPRVAWVLGVSFLVVMLLNGFILFHKSHNQSSELSVVAHSMNLYPSNTIYP